MHVGHVSVGRALACDAEVGRCGRYRDCSRVHGCSGSDVMTYRAVAFSAIVRRGDNGGGAERRYRPCSYY